MPTIYDFKSALVKAHRAGDFEAAQLFANKIKTMQGGDVFGAPTPTTMGAPESVTPQQQAMVQAREPKGFLQQLPNVLERSGTEMVGGTVGGILGAPLGPMGMLAGGTLGTMIGSEAARLKQLYQGREPEGISESIVSGLAGPVFGKIGEGVGAATRYMLHPRASKEAIKNLERMRRFGVPENLPAVTGGKLHAGLWETATKSPGGVGVGERWADEASSAMRRIISEATPKRAGDIALAADEMVSGAEKTVAKFFGKANQFRNAYNQSLKVKPDVDISGYAEALAGPMKRFGKKQAKAYGSSKAMQRLKALEDTYGIRDADGNLIGMKPVPWEEADAIRHAVGEDIGKARKLGTFEDLGFKDLKRQYSALTSDMEGAIKKSGNKTALDAWTRHKTYFRRGAQKVEKDIEAVIKSKSPESFLNAIRRGDYRKARQVWGSIPVDSRDVLRDEVIFNLGKAKPGSQGADGDLFSVNTFLTNYNKIGPRTLNLMFGRNKTALKNLDEVAKLAENIKDVYQMANTSRTSVISNFMKHADKFGGAGGLALIYLDQEELGGALLAGSMGGRRLARLMTKPSFIRWVAKGKQFEPMTNGFASHVARLSGLAGLDVDEQGIVNGLQSWLDKLQQPKASQPVPILQEQQ